MAWTTQLKVLAVMMVVTGSINSLATKWADKLESKGSDGVTRPFEHPFLQAAFMFIGEMFCLLAFKIIGLQSLGTENHALTRGNQNFNPFILMPAAMLDLVGTSIMYVGLTLTYVSSFQMFRGSIIIFVALLSMIFLDRAPTSRKWIGICVIMNGLLVVGFTDAMYESPADSKGHNSIITGNLLIIVAQMVSACQMVYEEKYVAGLNIPPLQAVGWEGVFGFSVLSVLLVAFYWIPAPPHFGNNARGTVEDVIDGFVQIGNNMLIMVAIMLTIISIAFFNFAGITVTKEMSATTRMVLDSVRTFVIWMVSLGFRWQDFHWVQLIGFSMLIYGMCEYNEVVPHCRRQDVEEGVREDVVNSDAAEDENEEEEEEDDDYEGFIGQRS